MGGGEGAQRRGLWGHDRIYRENSLELIELSHINKISSV